MRREKRKAENESRYLAGQDRLRAKRQRIKNADPSSRSHPAVDDGAVAGAFEPQPATFFSVSEK